MAAQQANLVLIGKSGLTYNVDLYLPDAAGTYVGWNANGPATSTSKDWITVPEDCILYDFSLTTSPTATNATLWIDNATQYGTVFRYANQLTSLPNRQRFRIPLKKGQQVQLVQAA